MTTKPTTRKRRRVTVEVISRDLAKEDAQQLLTVLRGIVASAGQLRGAAYGKEHERAAMAAAVLRRGEALGRAIAVLQGYAVIRDK